MVGKLLYQYIQKIEDFSDKEYLFSIILYSIAPVLSGNKPASLLTFTKYKRNLYDLWYSYKEDWKRSSTLAFYEVKTTSESTVVLFYHSEALKNFLNQKEHKIFLETYGYTAMVELEELLEKLKMRFQETCPHEMGLFLGIPLQDVIGFIQCKGKDYLLCGYWKVYHEKEKARKIFERYDEDKISMVGYINEGMNPKHVLEKLSNSS